MDSIYEIHIQPFTRPQLRNLGKGKGVRVYSGNHVIQVNKKQYTQFNKNMRLGKAFTYKPIGKHGKGILSDIFKFIKDRPALRGMANTAITTGKRYAHKGIDKGTDYAHRGINYLSGKAHRKVQDLPLFEGSGMRRRRTRRGRGILGATLSGSGELAGMIGGPGSDEAKKWLNGIGTVANVFGLGMKPKKRASPAQLKALALGRAIRDSKRGSGARKQYYHGSALLPAGY
jgi:hypothetical protein